MELESKDLEFQVLYLHFGYYYYNTHVAIVSHANTQAATVRK